LSIEANPALSAWLKEQVANSNRPSHRGMNAAATQYDSKNVLFCIDAGGLGSLPKMCQYKDFASAKSLKLLVFNDLA
jgi:hypothetical protein